jgi:hypothetical protein
MYRNCIFCSAKLGSNESIERFPVGRTLAFDAAKGRLWAVCPRCARWNLAPIEERWEAIDEAERLFRDARLRVQHENVGLTRLRDGTRLVRIGQAVAGEMAAWRYGREMQKRRTRAMIGDTIQGAGVAGIIVGALAAPVLYSFAMPLHGIAAFFGELDKYYRADRVAHRIPAADSPTWRLLELRWRDLALVRTALGEDGQLQLQVPQALGVWAGNAPIVLTGTTATVVTGKALVRINGKGAPQADLDRALDRIASDGGTEPFLRSVAAQGYGLEVPGLEYGDMSPTLLPDKRRAPERAREARFPRPQPLMRADSVGGALAVEIALHEESERRALQGDLAELHAAWRQAEDIAAIADALPDGLAPPEPSRLGTES